MTRTLPRLFLSVIFLLLISYCLGESHYSILGVSKNAKGKEIKKAYIKLAQKWHPDKNRGPNAEHMMSKINRAYEILSDEDKRRHYDLLEYEGDDGYTTTSDTTHGSTTDGSSFGEVNTREFMEDVLPASETTPYLIYFFHDFCDRCEDWNEILLEMKQDLTEGGISMAAVNVIISSKVASHCNVYVHEVPQLVLVFNRKPLLFKGSLDLDNVQQFVYDEIPSNVTTIAHVGNVNDIISMESRIKNNKPVVLFVSPQDTPSLNYKMAAFQYQQYLMFYFLSSLHFIDKSDDVLQEKLDVNSGDQVLRVYSDFPEPVAILKGDKINKENTHNVLEKYKFLTVPEVNSCDIMNKLCPIGEDNSWCVLLVTTNRSAPVANKFRNLANEWNDKVFKMGSLNNNQNSVIKQSISTLNTRSHDHYCGNDTSSKLILLLRRPRRHILKFKLFHKFCGTHDNNTKLLELLQSDTVKPSTAKIDEESCWFSPTVNEVFGYNNVRGLKILGIAENLKFKETFIVVISIFAILIPIYCVIKCSEKENRPEEIVTETKTPSYHNLSSTVALSSDEEPNLEESLTESEDDTDKPRQIVRMIRKVPMKDACTQTDDEFSSDDDTTFRNQRKPKKKLYTKSRDDSIARRTVRSERVDKLVEQTRKHDQWTSTY